MAIGIVGCTSCNKNNTSLLLQLLVARPSSCYSINKSTMLPVEKQISLHGMIWQRGGGGGRSVPSSSFSMLQVFTQRVHTAAQGLTAYASDP